MKGKKNIVDKIKKLLALSGSSNEHEAEAALLKARGLMAQYKLTEADVNDGPPEQEIDWVTLDEIRFSGTRRFWAGELAQVIADYHCCEELCYTTTSGRTYTPGFVGLPEDRELCVAIYEYAYNCIMADVKRLTHEIADQPIEIRRKAADSYGAGYVRGLRKAYENQQESHEADWGLVMMKPEGIDDYMRGVRGTKMHYEMYIDKEKFAEGYEEGMKFNPTKTLEEAVH